MVNSITLPQPETWYALNEKFRVELGLPEKTELRTFHHLQAATFEMVFGAAMFYSHKHAVGHLTGQSPAGGSLWPMLSKETFAIQNLPQESSSEELTKWASELKPDTSLVLMTEDNPVTGESFATRNQALVQLLSAKRIFSFRISHRSWRRGVPQPLPFEAWICEVSADLAFGVLGARLKFPTMVSPLVVPGSEKHENWLNQIRTCRKEFAAQTADSALLSAAERKIPSGFHLWSKHENLQDRLCIYHPGINAEAFCQELGDPVGLFPVNRCQNENIDLSWWTLGPKGDVLRGFLVVFPEAYAILADEKLTQAALQKCSLGSKS